MKPRIDLKFLTHEDQDQLWEILTETPNEAFDLQNGREESSVRWKIAVDFRKHFHLRWRDEELKVSMERQTISGKTQLLIYCAEVRSKEWWASFPAGSYPNDGGRSYRIQEGKTDVLAQTSNCALELSGDKYHIRLREVSAGKMH